MFRQYLVLLSLYQRLVEIIPKLQFQPMFLNYEIQLHCQYTFQLMLFVIGLMAALVECPLIPLRMFNACWESTSLSLGAAVARHKHVG